MFGDKSFLLLGFVLGPALFFCCFAVGFFGEEGVHEMTAISWKLGEGSTERSFTKMLSWKFPRVYFLSVNEYALF